MAATGAAVCFAVVADRAFDGAACERLLARVASTAEPPWRELVALLWPELLRLVRKSRGMKALAHSDDHVHNAALLTLEKLGKDGCRAARLYAPWRDAHPGKSLDDWLRIVTTNVVRDYVRERSGRSGARRGGTGGEASSSETRMDKRLLQSLATMLPDDDDLPPSAMLSATSSHAARELAAWAEDRLPEEQLAALTSWLAGSSFEEMAAELSIANAAAAKKLVRAAVATLRRYAIAASAA